MRDGDVSWVGIYSGTQVQMTRVPVLLAIRSCHLYIYRNVIVVVRCISLYGPVRSSSSVYRFDVYLYVQYGILGGSIDDK